MDSPVTSNTSPTAGDLEAHRTGLIAHCYRMLASVADAEDAVQETMIRAHRARDRFEGRASLKTWLTRIATRVCLDALQARKRRERPVDLGPAGSLSSELTMLPGERWIEPIPDALVMAADLDPTEQIAQRQSIRLAFVAALQHLAPRQRAALLLAEVVGWSAAEIAEGLDTTVAAVNSALQRARAKLASLDLAPAPPTTLPEAHASLVDRYYDAFVRYDVETLTSLLHEDAVMSMPPYALWLRGPEDVAAWLLGPGHGCRGSKIIPTVANGCPAFAQYRPGPPGEPHRPWALAVLEPDGDRVAAQTFFLDTDTLFPRFGMPAELA